MQKYQISGIRHILAEGASIDDLNNDRSRLIMFTSKAESYDGANRNLDAFQNSITIEMSHE